MASISMAEKAIHAERELQSLKTKYQLLQEFSENLKKQLDDTNNTLQKSRDDYYESIQGMWRFAIGSVVLMIRFRQRVIEIWLRYDERRKWTTQEG